MKLLTYDEITYQHLANSIAAEIDRNILEAMRLYVIHELEV